MTSHASSKIVVGVSSRALFDLDAEDRIFTRLGLDNYRAYQLEHEDDVLEPGTAFSLIKRFLALNSGEDERRVEVIVISHNNPETALRAFNSIRHYNLDITRAAFAGDEPLARYLEAFEIDLFLTCSQQDAQDAVDAGFAAAVLYKPPTEAADELEQLRIAFDGDAVLFSDESEAIYKKNGLGAFVDHETLNALTPLPDGPFANLLRKLNVLQNGIRQENSPIRIALVTARNSPAHERVIRTFRA